MTIMKANRIEKAKSSVLNSFLKYNRYNEEWRMTDSPTSIPRRVPGVEMLSLRPLSIRDRGRARHMQRHLARGGTHDQTRSLRP